MSYYEELLAKISVPESAVDCGRCSAQWKCCTYRPFIANFLVGKALKGTDTLFERTMLSEWDFTIAGISPNMKYRKYFLKKGKWGFGSDANLLCSFYEKSNGGCKIWSARPAVCRTFFCKSTYGDRGMSHWKTAEEFTWLMEWVLLEDFLHTEGWTIDEIKIVKDYLDEKSTRASKILPLEFQFKDIQKAVKFYQRSQDYVSGLTSEYVNEIIGEQGRKLYKDLLAQQPKVR